MKYFKIIAVLILIAGAIFILVRSPEDKKGKTAPDFETTLIDGSAFKLSELRDHYVVLDFWGSWCAPCRKDNPKLVQLYNNFKDTKFKDAKGFHVVTVALEKNERSWKDAADRAGFAWPHQIVTETRAVLLSPLARLYRVKEVPTRFFISPGGEIIGVNQSYESIYSYLREKSV